MAADDGILRQKSLEVLSRREVFAPMPMLSWIWYGSVMFGLKLYECQLYLHKLCMKLGGFVSCSMVVLVFFNS